MIYNLVILRLFVTFVFQSIWLTVFTISIFIFMSLLVKISFKLQIAKPSRLRVVLTNMRTLSTFQMKVLSV